MTNNEDIQFLMLAFSLLTPFVARVLFPARRETESIGRRAEILSSTTLTLEEIGQICGFSSAAAFCKVFKKFYHTTAHVWRQRIGKDDSGNARSG